MENIKELYKKAQEKVKEIEDFYNIYKDSLLASHNFKVYDVNHYIYTDMEKDFPLTYQATVEDCSGNSIFSYFCDNEYIYFTKLNNIELAQYVRRTSTFYLVPEIIQAFSPKYAYLNYSSLHEFIELVIHSAIEEKSNYDYIYISRKNNIMFDVEDTNEFLIGNLEIITELNIKEMFAECLEFYLNLKNFKDNQVEIFKAYCTEEEELQIEEFEKKNKKMQLLNNVFDFYEKSNNLNDEEKKLITELCESCTIPGGDKRWD